MHTISKLALTLLFVAGPAAADPENYSTLRTEWRGASMCLDIVNDGINRTPQLARCAAVSGQHWKATATSNGALLLTTEWRGASMCLDGTNDRAPSLAPCDSRIAGQYWRIQTAERGFVKLTTLRDGTSKCLDIVNDGDKNSRVTMAPCDNVSGQHWRMAPTR